MDFICKIDRDPYKGLYLQFKLLLETTVNTKIEIYKLTENEKLIFNSEEYIKPLNNQILLNQILYLDDTYLEGDTTTFLAKAINEDGDDETRKATSLNYKLSLGQVTTKYEEIENKYYSNFEVNIDNFSLLQIKDLHIEANKESQPKKIISANNRTVNPMLNGIKVIDKLDITQFINENNNVVDHLEYRLIGTINDKTIYFPEEGKFKFDIVKENTAPEISLKNIDLKSYGSSFQLFFDAFIRDSELDDVHFNIYDNYGTMLFQQDYYTYVPKIERIEYLYQIKHFSSLFLKLRAEITDNKTFTKKETFEVPLFNVNNLRLKRDILYWDIINYSSSILKTQVEILDINDTIVYKGKTQSNKLELKQTTVTDGEVIDLLRTNEIKYYKFRIRVSCEEENYVGYYEFDGGTLTSTKWHEAPLVKIKSVDFSRSIEDEKRIKVNFSITDPITEKYFEDLITYKIFDDTGNVIYSTSNLFSLPEKGSDDITVNVPYNFTNKPETTITVEVITEYNKQASDSMTQNAYYFKAAPIKDQQALEFEIDNYYKGDLTLQLIGLVKLPLDKEGKQYYEEVIQEVNIPNTIDRLQSSIRFVPKLYNEDKTVILYRVAIVSKEFPKFNIEDGQFIYETVHESLVSNKETNQKEKRAINDQKPEEAEYYYTFPSMKNRVPSISIINNMLEFNSTKSELKATINFTITDLDKDKIKYMVSDKYDCITKSDGFIETYPTNGTIKVTASKIYQLLNLDTSFIQIYIEAEDEDGAYDEIPFQIPLHDINCINIHEEALEDLEEDEHGNFMDSEGFDLSDDEDYSLVYYYGDYEDDEEGELVDEFDFDLSDDEDSTIEYSFSENDKSEEGSLIEDEEIELSDDEGFSLVYFYAYGEHHKNRFLITDNGFELADDEYYSLVYDEQLYTAALITWNYRLFTKKAIKMVIEVLDNEGYLYGKSKVIDGLYSNELKTITERIDFENYDEGLYRIRIKTYSEGESWALYYPNSIGYTLNIKDKGETVPFRNEKDRIYENPFDAPSNHIKNDTYLQSVVDPSNITVGDLTRKVNTDEYFSNPYDSVIKSYNEINSVNASPLNNYGHPIGYNSRLYKKIRLIDDSKLHLPIQKYNYRVFKDGKKVLENHYRKQDHYDNYNLLFLEKEECSGKNYEIETWGNLLMDAEQFTSMDKESLDIKTEKDIFNFYNGQVITKTFYYNPLLTSIMIIRDGMRINPKLVDIRETEDKHLALTIKDQLYIGDKILVTSDKLFNRTVVNEQITTISDGTRSYTKPLYYIPFSYAMLDDSIITAIKTEQAEVYINGYCAMPEIDYIITDTSGGRFNIPSLIVFRDLLLKNSEVEIIYRGTDVDRPYTAVSTDLNITLNSSGSVYTKTIKGSVTLNKFHVLKTGNFSLYIDRFKIPSNALTVNNNNTINISYTKEITKESFDRYKEKFKNNNSGVETSIVYIRTNLPNNMLGIVGSSNNMKKPSVNLTVQSSEENLEFANYIYDLSTDRLLNFFRKENLSVLDSNNILEFTEETFSIKDIELPKIFNRNIDIMAMGSIDSFDNAKLQNPSRILQFSDNFINTLDCNDVRENGLFDINLNENIDYGDLDCITSDILISVKNKN